MWNHGPPKTIGGVVDKILPLTCLRSSRSTSCNMRNNLVRWGGALVLTAGLASAATAAEWSMKVHGFFNASVIVSSLDDGYQGKSVYANPEIFF